MRPDKAMNIHKPGFAEYAKHLGEMAGVEIKTFADMKKALHNRIDYFNEIGAAARLTTRWTMRPMCPPPRPSWTPSWPRALPAKR